MTQNYQIRIGNALQKAWNIFLKAPEIFSLLVLGFGFAYYVVSQLPGAGPLLGLLLMAMAMPSIVVIAEKIRASGGAKFSDLSALMVFAPQILMVFVLKAIFVRLGLCLLISPGIYIAVIYSFAELFVLLEGKTFWEALEASRALVAGNWFQVFGLTVFCMVLFASGLLLAGIGVLLTGPLSILVLYCAFRELKRPALVVDNS
jgi:hypothetical protein